MSQMLAGFQETWHACQSFGKTASGYLIRDGARIKSTHPQNNKRLLLSVLQQGGWKLSFLTSTCRFLHCNYLFFPIGILMSQCNEMRGRTRITSGKVGRSGATPIKFFLVTIKMFPSLQKNLMVVASLLPTFPPSWNSHSGPTPHFIALTQMNRVFCFKKCSDLRMFN